MSGYRHPVENTRLDPIAAIQRRSFPAKYPGRCPACQQRIHVGDEIWLNAHRNAYHTACVIAHWHQHATTP